MHNRLKRAAVLVAFVASVAGCSRLGQPDEASVALHQEVADLRAQLVAAQNNANALAQRVSVLEAAQQAASAATPAPMPVEELKAAIHQCVGVVHARAEHVQEYEQQFYAQFDAFYNEGTRRVQNNSILVGSQPAVFIFKKCLAEHGFPLS